MNTCHNGCSDSNEDIKFCDLCKLNLCSECYSSVNHRISKTCIECKKVLCQTEFFRASVDDICYVCAAIRIEGNNNNEKKKMKIESLQYEITRLEKEKQTKIEELNTIMNS